MEATAGMESIKNYILVRKPSIPRYWDPISRPHVAVVVLEPDTGVESRYYLSRVGNEEDGKMPLEVADFSDLEEGTLLEVKYNSVKANLYQLELVSGMACWRWVGRCRGLSDFESERVDWDHLLCTDYFLSIGAYAVN
ncbi:hypothetical protein EU519_01160 [Candidatus Thorarchaeota archaeon]|nr:MAG: hypothetical protein EU519_01160 [Candidatus Thorarchaeota archaeon]